MAWGTPRSSRRPENPGTSSGSCAGTGMTAPSGHAGGRPEPSANPASGAPGTPFGASATPFGASAALFGAPEGPFGASAAPAARAPPAPVQPAGPATGPPRTPWSSNLS